MPGSSEGDAVKRFFDRVADRMQRDDASYVPFEDRRRDAQLRVFSKAFTRALLKWVPARSLVLDVGCGHGALLEPIVPDYRLIGVDFVIDMLPSARKRGYGVYHADATCLPFEDAQFDAVLCAEVFQHFGDLSPVLSELARVCRPGGQVIVSTLNRASIVRFAGRALSRVLHPNALNVPIIRRSVRDVAQAARACSLTVRETAWVCSPTQIVLFTHGAPTVVGPLATNFILCLEKAA